VPLVDLPGGTPPQPPPAIGYSPTVISALRPWTWLHRLPGAVWKEASQVASRGWRAWPTLVAIARVDFRKRYAGSVLGMLWYPLHSGLLLAMYCFVYMVVFSQRLPEMGKYDFVLFIFAGLVPYLAFSEAVTSSIAGVKSSLALLRNTVFPIELVPVKNVLVSLAASATTLLILLLLVIPTRHFGWHILTIPVPLVMLALLCLAAVWSLSAVAALVPDVSYLVNIVVLMLVFLSPIGFTLEQVPPQAQFVVLFNPLSYVIDSFRYALLGTRSLPWHTDLWFLLVASVAAATAAAFYRRLMPLFADHE